MAKEAGLPVVVKIESSRATVLLDDDTEVHEYRVKRDENGDVWGRFVGLGGWVLLHGAAGECAMFTSSMAHVAYIQRCRAVQRVARLEALYSAMPSS